MIESLFPVILVGAGLVVISILTSLISFRVGAPLLLVFLVIGLLAGEDGPGQIPFDDGHTAYFIGSIALAVILFDSGFGTRMRSFRIAAWPSLTLASLGVALTAALLAPFAHLFLDLSWLEAFLLGAIVGSTDAAAVFFLLRVGGINIRDRVRATLEVESGSNDPMAIFLTVTLVELVRAGGLGEGMTPVMLLQAFGLQMGLGLVAGLLGGWVMLQGARHLALEAVLHPLVLTGLALCLFAAVSMGGGSGFLAVYVAGLVVGNGAHPNRTTIRRFQEGLTWLAQITMFLTLGLLATPSQFPALAVSSAVVAIVLIFFARPLAVWICLLPFGFNRDETAFVAWVGLRGAVSILLAILPALAELDSSRTLFNAAFIIVLFSLVIQGWTIRPMAKWLGLVVPPNLGPVNKVELDLPHGSTHELVVYRVTEGSPVAEGERIPRWARPSLVIREGRSLKGPEAGRPQVGDQVYIFHAPTYAPLLDRLFAKTTALSAEDRAYFGDFSLNGGHPMTALTASYGIETPKDAEDKTIAAWMGSQLGGTATRGDRVHLGDIDLIVRAVADGADGLITEVGLSLDPEGSRQEPPMVGRMRRFLAGPRAWAKRARSTG
ncbi:potassium/proton antiporter [Rhodospirillum sp. A1_3_36]|uniref:potassium/proton antiporter n=1 Tax=Rhodospirillum sp. A1_3_36 TaxID=3391666 RepID=UPI0039A42F58